MPVMMVMMVMIAMAMATICIRPLLYWLDVGKCFLFRTSYYLVDGIVEFRGLSRDGRGRDKIIVTSY